MVYDPVRRVSRVEWRGGFAMGEAYDRAAFAAEVGAIAAGAREVLGGIGWSMVIKDSDYEWVVLGAIRGLARLRGIGDDEMFAAIDEVASAYAESCAGPAAARFVSRSADPTSGVVVLLNHPDHFRRGLANAEHIKRQRRRRQHEKLGIGGLDDDFDGFVDADEDDD